MNHFLLKNKTILIISPEKWGNNFLSKHHYALELSKKNNVFFLNAIANSKQKETIKTKNISENLTIISYNSPIKGLLKLPFLFIDIQFKPVIKEILKTINQPIDILWDFDQVRFSNYKPFNAQLKIFHPVDVIKNIPSRIKSRKAKAADVIFYLTEEIIIDINTSTPNFFINHGITKEYFKPSNNVSFPFLKKDKINVGYVGNLKSKYLDWKNLKIIVSENPKINFVFIGPYSASNLGGDNKDKDIDFLQTQNNVTLTDSKPLKELIEILPNFDAFLICYDADKYRKEVSNTHKLLEYCSTGKTIISNYISTYKEIPNVLEMVENNSNLPVKFKTIISNLKHHNTQEKTTTRIDFAKQNTYTNHLLKIEDIINTING